MIRLLKGNLALFLVFCLTLQIVPSTFADADATPSSSITLISGMLATQALTLAMAGSVQPLLKTAKLVLNQAAATLAPVAGLTPATAKKYQLPQKMREYQALTTSPERQRALEPEIQSVFFEHAPQDEKSLFDKLKPALRQHLPGIFKRLSGAAPSKIAAVVFRAISNAVAKSRLTLFFKHPQILTTEGRWIDTDDVKDGPAARKALQDFYSRLVERVIAAVVDAYAKALAAGPSAALAAAEAAYDLAIEATHRQLNEEFYARWQTQYARDKNPIKKTASIPLRKPLAARYFKRRTNDYGAFTTRTEKVLAGAAEEGLDLSEESVSRDYELYLTVSRQFNARWINQTRTGEKVAALYGGFLKGRIGGFHPYKTWDELLNAGGLDTELIDSRSQFSSHAIETLFPDQELEDDQVLPTVEPENYYALPGVRSSILQPVKADVYWWNLNKSFGIDRTALPDHGRDIDPEALYHNALRLGPELRYWFSSAILPHMTDWGARIPEFIPYVIELDRALSSDLSRFNRGVLYRTYGDVYFSLPIADQIRRQAARYGWSTIPTGYEELAGFAEMALHGNAPFNLTSEIARSDGYIERTETIFKQAATTLRKTFSTYPEASSDIVMLFETTLIPNLLRHIHTIDGMTAWVEPVLACFVPTDEFVAVAARFARDVADRALPHAERDLAKFNIELQKSQTRFPAAFPDARWPVQPIAPPKPRYPSVQPRPSAVASQPERRITPMTERIAHFLFLSNGRFYSFHSLQITFDLTQEGLWAIYKILLSDPEKNHIHLKGSMVGSTFPSIRYNHQSVKEIMGARDIAHAVYGTTHQTRFNHFVKFTKLPPDEAVAQFNDDIFDELKTVFEVLRWNSAANAEGVRGLTSKELYPIVSAHFLRLTRPEELHNALEWLLVHGYPIRFANDRWFLSGVALSNKEGEGWRLGQWEATEWSQWQAERGRHTFAVFNHRLYALASMLQFYLPALHRPGDAFTSTFDLLAAWGSDNREMDSLDEAAKEHALHTIQTIMDRIGMDPSILLWGEYRPHHFTQRTRLVLNFLSHAGLDDLYRRGIIQAQRILAARTLRKEPFTDLSQLAPALEESERNSQGTLTSPDLEAIARETIRQLSGASDHDLKPTPEAVRDRALLYLRTAPEELLAFWIDHVFGGRSNPSYISDNGRIIMRSLIFANQKKLEHIEDLLPLKGMSNSRLTRLLEYLYTLSAFPPTSIETLILTACDPKLPVMPLTELERRASQGRFFTDMDFLTAVRQLTEEKKLAHVGARPALYHQQSVMDQRWKAVAKFLEAHPQEGFTLDELRPDLRIPPSRDDETKAILEDLVAADSRFMSRIDKKRIGRTEYLFAPPHDLPPGEPRHYNDMRQIGSKALVSDLVTREGPLTFAQIRHRLHVGRYGGETLRLILNTLVLDNVLIKDLIDEEQRYRTAPASMAKKRRPSIFATEAHHQAVLTFVQSATELDLLRAGFTNPQERAILMWNNSALTWNDLVHVLDPALSVALERLPDAALRTTHPEVDRHAWDMTRAATLEQLIAWFTEATGNPLSEAAAAFVKTRNALETWNDLLYLSHLLRPADVLAIADHLFLLAGIAIARSNANSNRRLNENA